MGMNQTGFTNYYLNTTRVGSRSDLDYFYKAWYNVYDTGFSYSNPWNASNPDYCVPKVCTKVKTAMLSMGCDAKAATRVITSFKKWYSETY